MLCLPLLMTGCASVVKVEGEQVVNQRLVVKVTDAWNKLTTGGQGQPFEAWTQDGLMLDHLRFWAAIKPGQTLLVAPSVPVGSGRRAPQVPTFRAGMSADELVALFELVYAADGSLVTPGKVEPVRFAGEAGVRFEFAVVRKSDGVQLRGVGWVAVHQGVLFASTFVAPRLAFFGRLLPKAEAVVATARIQ
jgi:hypothetical protein